MLDAGKVDQQIDRALGQLFGDCGDTCLAAEIALDVAGAKGEAIDAVDDGQIGATAQQFARHQCTDATGTAGQHHTLLFKRHLRSPVAAKKRMSKRSEEPTSELQSLMRISYAVF